MFRHADGVCLCLVCILWQSSMYVLHDLQVLCLDLVGDCYVGMVICISCCTSDCMCRCDGGVTYIKHDLNRCSGWW